MGCSTSSSALDVQLKKDKIAQSVVVKLLLLGPGESGKSTVFKQMKLLYGKVKAFTPEQIAQARQTINENILVLLTQIIAKANEWGVALAEDVKLSKVAVMAAHNEDALLYPELAEHIKQLWKDPGLQSVWARRAEYQVVDSHMAYVEDSAIDRIAAEGYVPSNDDILRCRVRTSGITEESYLIDSVNFSIYDVGGQRNERRKWIHCFEDVQAVIFVVALSEFDQVLYEDHTKNRMCEALTLFEEIANNSCFASSSVILFLNKKDLFATKVKSVDIKSCEEWKDYHGDPHNYDDGCAYFETKFREKVKDPLKPVHCHFTCATDSGNVQVVFEACKQTILNANLRSSGFFLG
jgi:GTPase SAR1 family protein